MQAVQELHDNLRKIVHVQQLDGTVAQELPLYVVAFALVFYAAFAVWSVLPVTSTKRPKFRATFSSCCISVAHGLITTVLATQEILQVWPLDMNAANTPRQIFLMQFSLAYMVVDLVAFLLPFTPDDVLFVGHHCMTGAYMASSLWLGRGGISCIVLMALGESTSLLQNGWYIVRDLRRDSKLAYTLFKQLSPVYTVVFVLVRTIIGPPAISWLARQILLSQLPAVLRYFWAGCAILGVAGSQLWTYKLVRGFRKQLKAQPPAFRPKVH